MKPISILLFAIAFPLGYSISLRGTSSDDSSTDLAVPTTTSPQQRELDDKYYYSTSDPSILGKFTPDAAIGNPLKGLLTSPYYTSGNTPDVIPSTLDFYYIGLDQIMTGYNRFNWTVLDQTLSESASRKKHVIWRVICHFPGNPLNVPKFLIDDGTKIVTTQDGGVAPLYDDPKLLKALQQFVTALGQRYDGHRSLGFIQMGLLGHWGEWHTYPDNLVSDATRESMVQWYAAAFKKTQIQCRWTLKSVFAAGMGAHDDSFAHTTLGTISWFFWPQVEKDNTTNFWKKGAMGGETRPELQGQVFKPDYSPGNDPYKQDFMKCVNVTHATYMFTHGAFMNSYTEAENVNARFAHARMGYNFQVSSVGVESSSAGVVSVNVTVKQTGIAPFYYPLGLRLSCLGTAETLPGVQTLIDEGQTKIFSFQDIPATSDCLENVRITLESPYAYPGRPIKFAQGTNGTVVLNIPLPPADGSGGSSTGGDSGTIAEEKPGKGRFSILAWILKLLKRK